MKYLLVLFLVFSYPCFSQQKLPVINKNKAYPTTSFEPEVEVTYIPLETSSDILIDRIAHIYFVSNTRMLIANKKLGDIFIFDMNGKAISHFNHRGGKEYYYISYVAYDENKQEVYILVRVYHKIFIYSDKGLFKRSFNFPYSYNFIEIHNFDENSILAFHKNQKNPVSQRKPYMFISKKDGSILSELNIVTNKTNPTTLSYGKDGSQRFSIFNNYLGNCKFGNEFILANMSSDTIYLLKKDKSLTPLFVQTPSVFLEPSVVTSVGLKTDEFIIFAVFSFDVKEAKRRSDKGLSNAGNSVRYIMFDFKSGKFFNSSRENWVEKIDVPQNITAEMEPAYYLIDRMKNGKLDKNLKKMVSNLNEEDNPVVKITRIK